GKNSGVNRTRASAHHEAFERSKTHGGVDAAPFANRRQRTAVAQMTRHQFQRLQVLSQELRSTRRAIPMIDAVETITVNAAFVPFIRPWVEGRGQRHPAMEPGVENRDLWDTSQQLLNDFHALQFSPVVQRRELRDCGNSSLDFGGY